MFEVRVTVSRKGGGCFQGARRQAEHSPCWHHQNQKGSCIFWLSCCSEFGQPCQTTGIKRAGLCLVWIIPLPSAGAVLQYRVNKERRPRSTSQHLRFKGIDVSAHISTLTVFLLPPQSLLSVHDAVAQRDFEPSLPPLSDDSLEDDQDSVKIVSLVKTKDPLVSKHVFMFKQSSY